MLKTDAITRFLTHSTHSDLAALYSLEMECQVNVQKGKTGKELIGDSYAGKQWQGYSDPIGNIWKPFRIPYNANSDPTYTDSDIRFDLAEHALGIGMTGWNWKQRRSIYVAFDFDAITGHSDKHTNKLTAEQIDEVRQAASSIPWVTVRKSTSGRGLHLYIFIGETVNTQNHNEHGALARAILGNMSALISFDFESKVDICGGNMWVWHRKMQGTDGLELIKQGVPLSKIPQNWHDHVPIVRNKIRKIEVPESIKEASPTSQDLFIELISRQRTIQLEDSHKRLFEYLTDNDCTAWWDQDRKILVTHTVHIKEAFEALKMQGMFDTISTGRERPDHNCFCIPMAGGGWTVRRFSPGTGEAPSWFQDKNGWTTCYLNRLPDLKSVARIVGALEDPTSKGFIFREAESAVKALSHLGVEVKLPPTMTTSRVMVKDSKDGRIIMEVERRDSDNPSEMTEWISKKGKWVKLFNMPNRDFEEVETHNFDELVRHLDSETGVDLGWAVFVEKRWTLQPLSHVTNVLSIFGMKQVEIKAAIGTSILKGWTVVNRPFEPEFIGDRTWNRFGAQLKYIPSTDTDNLHYPHWNMILNHIGKGLDEGVERNEWCVSNGIHTGAEYLSVWIASLIQNPYEPLPYLFLFGEQSSGKSILHEALSLLMTRGYVRADVALTNPSGFNGELEGGILCVVEETDLTKNRFAYNRIKDWVTTRELSVHIKTKTPFMVRNTSHWIQCANELTACPVFPGDTRITMVHVGKLENPIPKKVFIQDLEKEAPDFLAYLLKLEIPQSNDRLNIPVIGTTAKAIAQQAHQSVLDEFLAEQVFDAPGHAILYKDFYGQFLESIDVVEARNWPKHPFGQKVSMIYPKGRSPKSNQIYIGNVSFIRVESNGRPKLLIENGNLVTCDGSEIQYE